jgi:hypothetical protein
MNIGEMFQDIEMDKDILNKNPKVQKRKAKMRLSTLKMLLYRKGNNQQRNDSAYRM